MLRIVANGRFLSRLPTGVDRVAEELLRAMSALMEADDDLRDRVSVSIVAPLDAERSLGLAHVPERRVGSASGHVWEQFQLPLALDGAWLLNACNTGPVAVRKSLTIMHDAQVRLTPAAYSRAFRLLYRALQPLLGRRCAALTTVSDYSRKQLERFGIAPPGKLRVVPNGCDHIDRIEADPGILRKAGLTPGQYFLVIGSLSPHKNIRTILEADERRQTDVIPIVIAGGPNPRVFAGAAEAEAKAENVRYLGRVSDAELKALYLDATALLFPSRYEGFGLPAAEAMRCGCPVVASTADAIREVCGDAALYADPNDVDAWAARMDEISGNEALRAALSEAGRRRSDRFTWKIAAQEIIDLVWTIGHKAGPEERPAGRPFARPAQHTPLARPDAASHDAPAFLANRSPMTPHVIIATKGRAAEVYTLLDRLALQSQRLASTIVVGATAVDVAGLAEHPARETIGLELVLTGRPGLPLQRNAGLDRLAGKGCFADAGAFAVFLDDDFRPDTRWLEEAGSIFEEMPDVVGITGCILADGVKGMGLTEEQANRYLAAELPPQRHWASGSKIRDVSSVYGCNMAWRIGLLAAERFDERLPLYAWQEDRDFTGRAARRGRTIYAPNLKGVHLGVKGERTSGVRLGYSQIANPVYLAGKGSMRRRDMWKFLGRSLASNLVKSLTANPSADFRGRFRGNRLALRDMVAQRLRPERILEL